MKTDEETPASKADITRLHTKLDELPGVIKDDVEKWVDLKFEAHTGNCPARDVEVVTEKVRSGRLPPIVAKHQIITGTGIGGTIVSIAIAIILKVYGGG